MIPADPNETGRRLLDFCRELGIQPPVHLHVWLHNLPARIDALEARVSRLEVESDILGDDPEPEHSGD